MRIGAALAKSVPVACRDVVVNETTRTALLRKSGIIIIAAIFSLSGGVAARAELKVLEQNTRFCPSWAEAHERTLASLNNGRPPFPVRWKGCIVLKRGTSVEIVDQQEGWTEIVVRGKYWFADE